MKGNKLIKKEILIIATWIFIIVLKFIIEPITQTIPYFIQDFIGRVIIYIWSVIGIILLSFCFTNLFSAILIHFKIRSLEKDSSEYLNRNQEFYIKLESAKYFATIFSFIYLLFASMFIMGIIFTFYNLILIIFTILKLNKSKKDTKDYLELNNKFNLELKNMVIFQLISAISYFFLKYDAIINYGNGAHYIKFLPDFIFLIIQTILYFTIFKKMVLENISLSIKSKFIITIVYLIIFSILLIAITSLSIAENSNGLKVLSILANN